MAWWHYVLAYLAVGLGFGYLLTGLGYKTSRPPYHKPWVMIDSKETLWLVLAFMVGWFPMLFLVLWTRFQEEREERRFQQERDKPK